MSALGQLECWLAGKLQTINHESCPRLARFACKWVRRYTLAAFFHSAVFDRYVRRLRGPADDRASGELEDDYLQRLGSSARARRNFRLYINFINFLYACWALQTFLLALLDLPAFAPLSLLDCLLVGRFLVNARVSLGVKYVSLLLIVYLAFVRLALTRGRPDFKLDCLDFLLRDARFVVHQTSTEQLKCHLMLRTARRRRRRRSCSRRETGGPLLVHKIHYKQRRLLAGGAAAGGLEQWLGELEADQGDSALFARTQFGSWEFRVLKLNRSPAHWFWYNCFAFVYMTAFAAFMVAWVCAAFYLMTPTTLTKRGFEFAYPNCLEGVANLVRNNRTLARQFNFIYEPQLVCGAQATVAGRASALWERVESATNATNGAAICKLKYGHSEEERAAWPALLPLEDFTSGWYHNWRSLNDYAKCLVLHTDFIGYSSANVLLLVYVCLDLLLNAHLIRRRLLCLHQSLSEDRAETRWPPPPSRSPPPPHRFDDNQQQQGQRHQLHHLSDTAAGLRRRRSSASYARDEQRRARPKSLAVACELAPAREGLESGRLLEMILLQALLIDHLKTTNNCNRLVSIYCLNVGAIWLLYSGAVVAWQGLKRGQTDFEFYAIVLSLALMVVTLLTFLAVIATSNRRFYPLVASVMALDRQHGRADLLVKKRWSIILSHFGRRPMYCFTLVSAEISNLLVLKYIAWVFSAFFVIVNFFSMRTELAGQRHSAP